MCGTHFKVMWEARKGAPHEGGAHDLFRWRGVEGPHPSVGRRGRGPRLVQMGGGGGAPPLRGPPREGPTGPPGRRAASARGPAPAHVRRRMPLDADRLAGLADSGPHVRSPVCLIDAQSKAELLAR